MGFYFVVHTLLGLVAGNAGNIQMKARDNVGAFPLWVHGSWGTVGASIMIFSALAAPVTTIFQWGIGWALVTLGEVILGAFIVGFFPMGLRFLLAAIGPVISVVIMSALWGFLVYMRTLFIIPLLDFFNENKLSGTNLQNFLRGTLLCNSSKGVKLLTQYSTFYYS